ncbi:MAG TPA: VOC family protein [Candidatus Binataceae bacterium]|nr:VOC family protein [Candidatus Binataceae bacterium]
MSPVDGVRMRFDHVSIAVASIERGVAFFERYFPTRPRHARELSEQAQGGFQWQDIYLGGTALEFIEELPGREGFIARFIARHGEGLHHLSYEVDRIDPMIAALKADGVRVADEHTFPDGQKTCFISPRAAFGVLIQLWQPIDYDAPAPRPADDGRARFDHVAIAVREIGPAMEFFRRYFPAEVVNYPIRSSSQGNFVLAHLDVAGFKLEFLQSPGPNIEDDFVRRFVDRYGEGMHHVTIDVRDFEAIAGRLKADGVRLVGLDTNWRGERQFFISPQSAMGTLVQVWDGLGGPAAGSE